MGIKASASVTVAQVTDGTDGNGIKSTVVEYQAGSSGTTAPTGSWSTSIPATSASAPYLWTKVTYTYTDGSAPKVVYSVGSTPEGIVVGGRNLAQRTSSSFTNPFTNFTGGQNVCPSLAKVLTDGLSVGDIITIKLIYKYTDVVATSGHTAICYIQGAGDVTVWNAGKFELSPPKTLSGSGEHEFLYSFRITADHLKNSFWDTNIRHDYVQSGSVQWKMFKVEKGNKATDWTPAPEDVDASIAAVDKKVNNAQLEIDAANGKITTLTSETSSLGTRMSTVEQTATDLTVRINTTDSNVATAQSTADTAKKNAATAQSTANTAKSTADTAKSTADTAKANAATAQSTADTAKANAATAQSTANTARNEAANAAKTATNYLNFSSKGLIVGDMTASTLGNNVLIDSDSVDIRSGNTILASFGSQHIYIGKESRQSTVDFCNGLGTIGYKQNDYNMAGTFSIDSEYSIGINSKEIGIFAYYHDTEDSLLRSQVTFNQGTTTFLNAKHPKEGDDYGLDGASFFTISYWGTEIKSKSIAMRSGFDDDNTALNVTGTATISGWAQVVGTLTVGSTSSNSGIEIYHDTPFIDFHANRSGTVDFTSRIIADTDGGLTFYTQNGGCAYKLLNGFFRTYGNTGWYSETYGGGWYMIDNVWVRTYGEKSLYTGAGSIYTHGGEFYAALDHGLHCVSTGHWIIRTFNSSAGMVSVGVGNGSEPLRLFTNDRVWKGNSTTTYFSTASSSDKRLKKDFGEITDAYEKMYMDTDVYSFRYILEDDIIHYGFMAQDVIENMKHYGIPLDNNLYGKSKSECFERDITGDDYTYNINYLEWIPLNKHMIMKTINRLDKFEESSQQQIDQLREELSQTRIDYVELLTEVKRLKEKLESIA